LEKKKNILSDHFHKLRSSDNTQKFNERLSDGVNFKFRKYEYELPYLLEDMLRQMEAGEVI